VVWLRLKQDLIAARDSLKWGKVACWQWLMPLRRKRAYDTLPWRDLTLF
jgi:hypothetical protein